MSVLGLFFMVTSKTREAIRLNKFSTWWLFISLISYSMHRFWFQMMLFQPFSSWHPSAWSTFKLGPCTAKSKSCQGLVQLNLTHFNLNSFLPSLCLITFMPEHRIICMHLPNLVTERWPAPAMSSRPALQAASFRPLIIPLMVARIARGAKRPQKLTLLYPCCIPH